MARMTQERHDRIVRKLDDAEKKEIIRSWQSQSDMPGVRWTVEGFGFTTRIFTTPEIEAFLLGCDEAYIACRVYLAVN